MNIKEFIDETHNVSDHGIIMRPKIVCKDGFFMSVQASESHYCSPRNNQGHYNSVEIGFPSEKEDLIMEFIDGDMFTPTQNVYGWVPVETVQDVINKHGGIDVSKTFSK